MGTPSVSLKQTSSWRPRCSLHRQTHRRP